MIKSCDYHVTIMCLEYNLVSFSIVQFFSSRDQSLSLNLHFQFEDHESNKQTNKQQHHKR